MDDGITVSPDLICTREQLKASILMPPSGLYLAWLEAEKDWTPVPPGQDSIDLINERFWELL